MSLSTLTLKGLASVLLATGPALAQGTYSVPSPREVRQAAEDATAELEAGLWAPALDHLEVLLADGASDLLPEPDGQRWTGAAAWARRQLIEAPPELRELFSLRSAERAAQELSAATAATPGRRAATLIDLTRRYPTTPGAARAWLALGDLRFEAGEPEAAQRAWERAAATAELLAADGRPEPGLTAALELRRAAPLPAPAPPASPAPPRLDGAWFVDLPSSPSDSLLDHLNLRPVTAGSQVFVNTGLRVLAVDTTRGELQWDTGEVAGWEGLSSYRRRELVKGVGLRDLVTSLAVAGGTVVAPLQLPDTSAENDDVDGLTITVGLPERRLFAFDAATGAPRWSHAPTPTEKLAAELTGASLPFAQRARIAGPPLVVGSRVLVPCYELVGRINLFVAAYDLATGAELWRTATISGQQRVNLFGEHEVEFNSAPLTLAGERVLVQTQLGALVALDLDSGEPLWATGYEQYDLPRTRGYYTPERRRRWQNTAPLVHGELVLAAPVDSPDLLALDLETGALAWSVEGTDLERLVGQALGGGVTLDHLAAVGPEGLWLGGDALANLFAEGGDLASAPPNALRYAPVPTPGALPGRGSVQPRALAVTHGDELVVPTDRTILAVDRATGRARELGPTGELAELEYGPASLAVGSGRVLGLDGWRLAGWLHWDTLIGEGRAALAAEPSDAARLELLEMLLARTHATREQLSSERALLPGFTEDPSSYLAEADELLAQLGPERDPARRERIRFDLEEARGAHLADLGQVDGALVALAAAREAAAGLPSLRQREERTRLACATLAVLGPGPGTTPTRAAARRHALDELATALGDEPVPEQLALEQLELFAPGLVPERGALATAPGALPIDQLGVELASAWTSLRRRLPVGLLALVARASDSAEDGDAGDALEDLHTALWEYGPLEVARELPLAPLVHARIDALLTSLGAGAEQAYQPFEQRAQEQLERARREPLDERGDLLRGLALRYPHSLAAGTAELELLDAELARYRTTGAGLADLAMACHRALASLQSEAPARALLGLAWALGEAGNPHLERLLLERLVSEPRAFGLAGPEDLARLAPEFTGGRTALELLGALPPAPQDGPASPTYVPSFGPAVGSSSGSGGVRLGAFHPLQTLDLGPDGTRLLVSSNNAELFALAGGEGGTIAWTFPIGSYSSVPWERRILALPSEAPERLCVLSSGGIVALDPRTGYYRWEASRPDHRPLEVAGDGGLVLVEWLGPAGRLLEAFDVQAGTPLWTLELADADRGGRVLGSRLLVEGDRAVVLDRDERGRALVVDLVRGRLMAELDLGDTAEQRDRSAAWVAGGQLLVPHFFAARGRRPNALEAWDLGAGASLRPASYQVTFGAGEELAGMALVDGTPYLWLLPATAMGVGRLVQLDVGLGALREVTTLGPNERPLGFDMGASTHLTGDLLVTVRPPEPGSGRTAPLVLRGLELPLGPLWSLELAQPADSSWRLYDGVLPTASLSDTTLALVYALTGDHASMGQQTRLLLVDREQGVVTQDRVLTSRLGRIDDIDLVGIEDELLLFGRGSSAGRGRLEVLASQASRDGDEPR